jgi:hypothetical protein
MQQQPPTVAIATHPRRTTYMDSTQQNLAATVSGILDASLCSLTTGVFMSGI